MKKWLFTVLLLIVFPVLASHIVGGEFELLYISGNTYRLNLILYFDKLHGSPGAKDPDVTVSVYRKSDNVFMTNLFLPMVDSSDVGYTQPECSHNEIVTQKLVYSANVILNPAIYNDPQGYYISWQRCCRNYQITNIYSDNPAIGTNTAGQTFYLEFPPVQMNGQPFRNSSPRLFPPLNDYASPFRPYYVDFAGIDDDGDSLAYSLVEPLNTTTSDALPPASPAPYDPVTWKPGFDLDHIILGNPDLKISSDGFLTVTPTMQGLFVFAVKVDEFRNGVKIGQSRRDFQMLVTDTPLAFPPQILGKAPGESTFGHDNTMSVSFNNTVPDNQRCIEVRVSDPDSNLPTQFSENIGIRVIPLNFKKSTDLSGISFSETSGVLVNGSTKDFTICFPECPYLNGPYQIGIIAFDDACALPLTDTLKVTVNVQPPPNTAPHFTSATPISFTLAEGDSMSWYFRAVDDELDNMTVALLTDGFILADAGMEFSITKVEPGLIEGKLHWDAYCNIYDFTHRTNFQVRIMIDDIDQCLLADPKFAVYNLAVQLPPLSDPVIDTDLTPNLLERRVDGLVRRINESLDFTVTGLQACCDNISLQGKGIGFDPAQYGVTMPPSAGTVSINTHFQWNLTCDKFDLNTKSLFEFQFIVIDHNKCHFINNDTVNVELLVLPPLNEAPVLTIESQNASVLNNNAMSIILGQPVALGLFGNDPDTSPTKDSLTLTLVEATGNVTPEGYTFETAKGYGNVQAPFTWTPDCSVFKDGIYENEYDFKFAVVDGRCFNVKGDTMTVHLKVKDIVSNQEAFLPYNVITPNGDGCNDYFAMEGIDPVPEGSVPGCGYNDDPDSFVSLPKDNCAGRFEFVRIVNRWGKLVFESSDRTFRWYAPDETAGVYYYYIQYGETEYKGTLSVRP